MTKGEPVLQLDKVSAFLREGHRVDDVSLLVRHGELVALVGGNNSGKSLALRLAAGLEAPLTGMIRLLGVNPALAAETEYIDLRRRVGVVFDRPGLLSNMNVFNNVALPLRYHTVLSEPEIQDKVMAALREWNVEHLREQFPAELMLGDARFVALARAEILDPEILFLDDMLLGLDATGLVRLRGFFERMRVAGKTTLITSAGAATKLFEVLDRLLFFRNGRFVADARPAEVVQIKDPAVQELFGV
ncbi:MAG TPA: ATP-binding cassette domain-containing protein [Nitrospirales bacterium]|jgi:phospholipid/cholesterol/gamma-HCH transport system ATP-binding protein